MRCEIPPSGRHSKAALRGPGRQEGSNHEGTKDTKGTKGTHEDGADPEKLATAVVDAGLKVHRALGPGLLESAYEHCLSHELQARGLIVCRQIVLPIVYDGARLDAGYRVDLMVGHAIIMEIKAVTALTSMHHAQLLTYLKLSGCRIGFLMNFHVALFKDGLKRIIL